MSLNFTNETPKPCTKPYELTLNDCLACSSCITSSEQLSLTKATNLELLKQEAIFFVVPHAKINVYNKIKTDLLNMCKDPTEKIKENKRETNENEILNNEKWTILNTRTDNCITDENIKDENKQENINFCNITYRVFEKILKDFLIETFNKSLIDTSHFYDIIYSDVLTKLNTPNPQDTSNLIITSSCPGTVLYIERKAHHLINNLLKTKTTQQIASTLFTDKSINISNKKLVSVVTCLDKKLENDGNLEHVISTREFYSFLEQNDFVKYVNKSFVEHNSKRILKNIEIYRSIEIDEKFIEYFIANIPHVNYQIFAINKDFTEYVLTTDKKVYKFARIFGLNNVINFINRCKKRIEYDFVESFICKSSCINGPAQISGLLDEDREVMIEHENIMKSFVEVDTVDTDDTILEIRKNQHIHKMYKTKLDIQLNNDSINDVVNSDHDSGTYANIAKKYFNVYIKPHDTNQIDGIDTTHQTNENQRSKDYEKINTLQNNITNGLYIDITRNFLKKDQKKKEFKVEW